jgi:hypothetical protein
MPKWAGEFIFSEPGSDKKTSNGGTLQCVHCGAHWLVQPGSGKIRGWCMQCNGPFCGPQCAKCIPTDLLLENMEKGRPLDYRPIIG